MKKEISDLELIDKVKNGDNSAFREIVNMYEGKIASTVYGMLGKNQEAEDIGQEVFIRFYKSINNFRGDAQLSTYLTRIAINLSLNEIKKRRLREIFSFESWTQTNDDTAPGEIKQDNFERSEIIKRSLDKLDAKYRSVIVLRLIDGYSTEETAEILNLPLGTVLSRLSRGQQKLKNLLAPYQEEL